MSLPRKNPINLLEPNTDHYPPCVVAYYKQGDKLVHQSYVFVSDEPHQDGRFVFARITKLVPMLLALLPCLKFVHYWTDSPTSQERNKTIFKILSCHQEYFIVLSLCSYMESGHGEGPCNPVGGTAKRKAHPPVKNDQMPIIFFAWAKETEETKAIRFHFLSSEDYANAALFLTEDCKDIKPVHSKMKLHLVLLHAANKILVRDTSCFGNCCFQGPLQQDTSCEGW